MNRLASFLAGWIVRRPAAILALAVVITLGSVGLIATHQAFDTDILNLLPADHPAVRGLKIYNTDFTQTREIAFLLTWKTAPEDVTTYRERFADLLRRQSWVVRLLDKPPLEEQGAGRQINEIVAPLLLNLPADQFEEALAGLTPEALGQRIQRLSAQMEAGSPRAQFELSNDPLGLAGKAARPVWETISISDTFELVSADGTAVIVPAITNQTDNSAQACEEMMEKVHAFVAEARRELGPDAPEIGVTGRTPYVDEIAASMQRDITITSSVSLFIVVALFWVGFRRIVPLIGITLILALTALSSMAVGVAVFSHLNIIAISFCSILFGLGDDFSLLLCQHYYQAQKAGENRREAIASAIGHCLPGMLWVAVTTGVGFLALSFSGSAGFAQLGVLVAVGVLLCALFMPIFLFPFLSSTRPSTEAALGPAAWFADQSREHPRRLLGFSLGLLVVCTALALSPWNKLGFDISPTSLEPRHTPAAQTLARMMEKFPATFEPVMVVLPEPDGAQLQALNHALADLKNRGLIESFSSPSGLVLDQARIAHNKARLRQADLGATQTALQAATQEAGLHPMEDARQLLTALQAAAQSDQPRKWVDYLPPQSPWWFLLDRMISPNSPAIIAYLKVPKTITPADRVSLEKTLTQAAPSALVTGWSQTLASLIPWAQRELIVFGSAVAAIVLLILAFVYRSGRLWLLHTISIVGALAGTAATLKLLNVPINLLNVLAFPLMLGVGVDYGTHLILAARQGNENLAGTIKAVTLSGLTTSTGFGALVLAQNPALSGLGAICGIGVLWCLLFSLLIIVPGTAGPLAKSRHAR